MRVGVRARRARHADDVLDTQRAGELDGAAHVVGVLGADAGQRVERVAVAVEPGQLHAAGGELAEVVRAGLLGGQQQVDVAVRGRDEAAGVDLHRGQAVVLEHLQGLGEGAVVQAGGVGAELESHDGGTFRSTVGGQAAGRGRGGAGVPRARRGGRSDSSTGGAVGLRRLHDRLDDLHAAQPVGERRVRRQRVGDTGDLVEERPGLVGELLLVADADARRLHRVAALEVRHLRADDHLPQPPRTGLGLGVVEQVLGGPVEVERRPTRDAVDRRSPSPLGMPKRGAGHRERGRQPGREPRGEGGGVLVLDLAHLVADGRGVVPDDRAQRQRPLGDLDRQVRRPTPTRWARTGTRPCR